MNKDMQDLHIISEIEIDASPQEIWDVLFDYDRLGEWSNGFLGTDKPMKAGEVSTAYFKNPITGKKMGFTHEVLIFDPPHSFGWSGEIGAGHHDHHIYEITDLGNGRSKVTQSDGIYGKRSNFFTRLLEKRVIEKSYDSFNAKLKARVESLK